jgi:hypothetical protein
MFCGELNQYLKQRFNYKKDHACTTLFKPFTITARRKKFDLYLRWQREPIDDWQPNTLVIARIEFQPSGMGHGTHFLKWIIEREKKYNIQHIGLEHVNQRSLKFGTKNGFKSITTKNMSKEL